ncbi:MAG: hypothetical protein V4649_15035 [Bacteroidota bacterium]
MVNPLKFIACLLTLGFSISTGAQQVSYTVIEKDPDKYKRTILYLDLINCDTYNDISAGYAAKLETVVGNRLMLWGQLKRSWLDAAARSRYNYPVAADGLQKHAINDFGGVFFLTNKNKDKHVKVVLRSSSGGGYSYSKYIMVPATMKSHFGIRGGLFYNAKVLELDNDAHKRFRYESLDGTMNLPIEDVGSSAVQPAGNAYCPLPLMKATSLYSGLHIRKITNVRLKVGRYGKRANAKVVDVFADLMYGTSTDISNVRDVDGVEWKILPQNGAIRKIGWRIGYSIHSARTFHYQYSAEFGRRPGAIVGDNFTSNGTYITLAMGVSIGSGQYLHFKRKEKTGGSSSQ